MHFSYLPLAHITERLMVLYALSQGMAIGFFSGDYSKIFDDMAKLRPTFMVAAPGPRLERASYLFGCIY